MGLPIAYSTYLFFYTPPPVFSGVMMTWFINPHFAYFDDFGAVYKNDWHTFNNLFVCATESLIYGTLIFLYVRATRSSSGVVRQEATRDKRIYIQVVLVGLNHFIAGFTYVVIQFFPVTNHYYVILMAAIFYCLSTGTPPLIYIGVNRSVRNQILYFWRAGKKVVFSSSAVDTTTNAPHSVPNSNQIPLASPRVAPANPLAKEANGVNRSTPLPPINPQAANAIV
ncbi:hypothetical protein M3Y99_00241400 [Aphelenchoides fujianensis]|nr:hypothetical protein M3Y99_00241400 [Aphelenchoides fujianensis]